MNLYKKNDIFFEWKDIYRDLLRETVESKSERGEQLNALMKEGKLVPMVCYYLVSFAKLSKNFLF
jgi:adenylate kinase family enzyme